MPSMKELVMDEHDGGCPQCSFVADSMDEFVTHYTDLHSPIYNQLLRDYRREKEAFA